MFEPECSSKLTAEQREAVRSVLDNEELMKLLEPVRWLHLHQPYFTPDAYWGLLLVIGEGNADVLTGYVRGLSRLCSAVADPDFAGVITWLKVNWVKESEKIVPENQKKTPEEYRDYHSKCLGILLKELLGDINCVGVFEDVMDLCQEYSNFETQMTTGDYMDRIKGYVLALYFNNRIGEILCRTILDRVTEHFSHCYQVYESYMEAFHSVTEESPDALKHQVGGTHYSKYEIQPVELIEKLNLDFICGNILKYVVRYKDKNGIEDLKKAEHYAEMLHQSFLDKFDIAEKFVAQFKDDPEVQRTLRILFSIGMDSNAAYEVREKLYYLIKQEEDKDD